MTFTLDAYVNVNEDGIIHENDIEITSYETFFLMKQGDIEEDNNRIFVRNEQQAHNLILAIKAMCAGCGWRV